MSNESPQKALGMVLAVALVCSVLVSTAAITLRPIQLLNERVERSRNVVALTGLIPEGEALTGEAVLAAVEELDVRVVDLATGEFEPAIDPLEFDERAAAQNETLGVPVPSELDLARIGRRSRYKVVYLVWDGANLQRVILPIHGQGMWSTLYGFIALEADLNTVADVTFYEQAETAGLGEQIVNPQWQARWRGRQIHDTSGAVRLRIAPGRAADGAPHDVDALTGATVTGDAVTALIAYWFGPHGYANWLSRLENQPPVRAPDNGSEDE